jgi:glycosyltransferase involved in cell wall biosynthesis
VSFVVPACNAELGIAAVVQQIGRRLDDLPGSEILVVENGSTDATWDVVCDTARQWTWSTPLVPQRSVTGIGAAYRAGVAKASGTHVLLSADDLPFGFTDLEEFLRLPDTTQLAIGSKAHPQSVVNRSLGRVAATKAFGLARRGLLNSQVGDTQGTFWLDAELARRVVNRTVEDGFAMTTELVILAERDGVRPVEVPVALLASHQGASRIHWAADTVDMLGALVRIRRRWGRSAGPRKGPAVRREQS